MVTTFLLASDGNRGYARASRLAVYVYRAGATQRHAAAKLGSGKTHFVAQHPQQRGVRGQVDVVLLAVDVEFGHFDLLLSKVGHCNFATATIAAAGRPNSARIRRVLLDKPIDVLLRNASPRLEPGSLGEVTPVGSFRQREGRRYPLLRRSRWGRPRCGAAVKGLCPRIRRRDVRGSSTRPTVRGCGGWAVGRWSVREASCAAGISRAGVRCRRWEKTTNATRRSCCALQIVDGCAIRTHAAPVRHIMHLPARLKVDSESAPVTA